MKDALVAIAAFFGPKELLQKVLGPTAEYLGLGIRDWTKKRVDNVATILHKAQTRIDDASGESLSSAVSPQLLRTVLEFGSYTEDALIQEYLAGLLFSARRGRTGDGRSAALGMLLENLSSYEVRFHYLIYHTVRKLYTGTPSNVGLAGVRDQLQTYFAMSVFHSAVLAPDGNDSEFLNSIVESSVYGLLRHGLVSPNLVFGSPQHIKQTCIGGEVPDYGIVLQPSILGIELYLWIGGVGSRTHSSMFLNKDILIPDLVDLPFDERLIFRYPT